MKKISDFCTSHPALLSGILTFFILSAAALGTEINKLDVRFALLVQELDFSSLSFFPKLNGVCYPDYFIPGFILSYITTLGGRCINLWTLALPTILLSSLFVGLVCRLGERLQKGAGIAASLLLMATPEAVFYMCSFSVDIPVAVAGCLMLFEFQKAPDSRKNVMTFSVLLLLSIMFRGSLGLLVFSSAAGGFLLFRRKWKMLLFFCAAGTGTAVLAVLLIFLGVYLQEGREQIMHLVSWQINQRVKGGDYFYYFIHGLIAVSPLSLFAVAGLIINRKNTHDSFLRGLLGWIICPLIILSIPGGKHLRYMLPLLPAFALIGGLGIVNCPVLLRERISGISRFLGPVLSVAGAAAAITVLVVCISRYPASEIPYFSVSCALVLFLFLFFAGRKIFKSAPVIPALDVIIAVCLLAIPLTGLRESSHLFAEKVESIRKGRLYFYETGPDQGDLKYALHVPVRQRRKICYIRETLYRFNDYQDKMFHIVPREKILQEIRPEDVVILSRKHLVIFQTAVEKTGRSIRILHSGDLGHRVYCAVALDSPNKDL